MTFIGPPLEENPLNFLIEIRRPDAFVHVSCALAVTYRPFDFSALVAKRYPFPVHIPPLNPAAFRAEALMKDIWRAIAGMCDLLLQSVNSLFSDAFFHRMDAHPLSLLVNGTQTITSRSADDFLIFPSQLQQPNASPILMNGRQFSTPATSSGHQFELSVTGKVIILPISPSDRDWIGGSPFQLLVLMKHLYCMSKTAIISRW
jgi:hypothetical protein